MVSREMEKVAEVFKILGNLKRLEIINLCQKPHTVTEISKKLKIPLTRTSEYITQLKRVGLISKTRNKDNSISIKSLIQVNNKGELKRKE